METNSTVSRKRPNDTSYPILGVAINEYEFQGRIHAPLLMVIAKDPRIADDSLMYEVRSKVQRPFETSKAKNVRPYAEYIAAVHRNEKDGLTPSIVLYSPEPLEQTDQELRIPFSAQLVAIDGETQLAARYDAAKHEPSTKEEYVKVTICHGRPISWGQQAFHDLNQLAVKVNAAVSLAMDQHDPMTGLARKLATTVPILTDRVNMKRRTLRKTDKDLMTITALRGACITFALGISGVKFGAKPVTGIDASRLPHIQAVAVEWFTALTNALTPAFIERSRFVAGGPSVMAALGAFGHPLLEIADPTERAAEIERRIALLQAVNWERSSAWAGVAGKVNSKGQLILAGTKEIGHSIYNALTDVTNTGYERIRGQQAAA